MDEHQYATFSPNKAYKKKCKSHVQCSVYGCTNRSNFGLYKLPSKNENDRRKQWIHLLRMEKVVKNAVVCGQHFKDDDFKPSVKGKGKIKRLKKSAVPSQYLPKSVIHKSPPDAKKTAIANRELRAKKRLALDNCVS
ncbi:uncharacterized protein LOC135833792 [Planococcus citri]|uniref:uncharacterized protein LOC135833792 n=1 Tax=Planococcus citri TaxID=170843 RepID=UPI0031F841B3